MAIQKMFLPIIDAKKQACFVYVQRNSTERSPCLMFEPFMGIYVLGNTDKSEIITPVHTHIHI